MNLMESIKDKSAVVVLGSGGVGKTTVAASVAALWAIRGKRVLAVTVDPSNRLKSALGLSGRFGVEEDVDLHDFGRVAPGGGLTAMILSARTELDRLVARAAPSDEVRERITGNPFYAKAAGRMSGTHEYLAMERLLEARESGRYNMIVLDTPPDAHALDFLDAPLRLGNLLDSEAFKMFAKASSGVAKGVHGGGAFGLSALKWRTIIVKGMGKFTGEDTFLGVLDFVLAFAPMFDELRRRAIAARDWLTGPSTATLLVARPESELSVTAEGFIKALARRRIKPCAILVNRTHIWPPVDCPAHIGEPVGEVELELALEATPGMDLEDRAFMRQTAKTAWGLADSYRDRAQSDRELISELAKETGDIPVVILPILRQEIRDSVGLARFAGSFMT